MKLIQFDYVPDAVAPLWTAFVEETFRELAECVQIAVGYSLIGITIEKVVFLLLGPTNSGKTTFLATLRTIFLTYCARIQIESLMTGRHDDSNNVSADLSDLRGARLVVSSETEEGQRLRESKLKSITQGMGTVKAARKYENPIEFTETHTLWIDANHAPAIRGSDDAIWKRLFPFPCRHTVPEERRDRKLGDKFITQATGIVSWAVAGALKYMKSGLPRPEIVEQERARWRESQDVLGEFLEECCIQDEDSKVKASELYAAYREWIQKQGHSPLSQTAFGTRLFDRGINRRRERDGGGRPWFYVGLRLQRRERQVP
jgi:putative DNA primase/helicase